MIKSLNGKPGTTWTNDTGKVRYQLVVDWHNSCGLCIQYDHAIGSSWPIPFHYGCRCKQIPIYPGGESRPFVDFAKKVNELPPAERGKVAGVSNMKLLKAGLADWSDVVTEGRVRDFREVVSLKKLSVKELTDAGVKPRVAERAFASVHTAAHDLAEESRRRIFEAMREKGLAREQSRRAVAERLAARTSIGEGPSGPQASPVKVGPAPKPLPFLLVAKALGLAEKVVRALLGVGSVSGEEP